ncbi:MAG TPA: WG repeat-containing protein, partial [Cytophagales bacterium]
MRAFYTFMGRNGIFWGRTTGRIQQTSTGTFRTSHSPSALTMKLPQTMRLATLVLLLTGTPLLLPAQPQPANHAPAPAWARQYDTFSRSEDGYIVSKGDKKGVVSLAGKPVTKLVYDTILPFRGGMAIVGTLQRSRFKTRGKYGFINQEGRLVVLMVHYFVNSFSEGLAFIQGDALHVMYINQQGDTAISMKGGFGEDFHGGMAAVGVGSELGGSIIPGNNPYQNRRNFIDRQGNLLIPARYDSIGEYVYYGIRTVKRHGKYGFLDTTGREVLPPAFDDMDYDSSYFWGNRRRVGRDGRFGFVDTYTGRLVVPLRYEGSLPSRDSTCWLKLNGKWGLVSRSGRTLVPFQYDQAGAFSEGLARVGKGGKAGHVNGRGEVV